MPTIKTIAFIGIGRMGFHMAGHLAKAGYTVLPIDTNAPAVADFHAKHGGKPVASLAEAGARADAVITMLPTSHIVRDVVLGTGENEGLAASLRPGTTLIDMSTSDPHDTRALGEALANRKVDVVDAPVAGGVVFAKDGTLDITTGGDKAVVAKIEPVLLAMGRQVTYCGPLGAGHAMKALNNYVNAAVLGVYLEALVAGRKFGIDLDTMLGSLEAATLGRNHPYEKKIKTQILTRAFATNMRMDLIAKDVGIAVDLAKKQGLRAPLAECVQTLWKNAAAEIGPERDQTEIVRYWENVAGLTLEEPKAKDS